MRFRMPSSNLCGCTLDFRKSAHDLNKPIGSSYLKYVGTRGRLVGRVRPNVTPLDAMHYFE
jgi:hypothetical protein